MDDFISIVLILILIYVYKVAVNRGHIYTS